MRTRPAAAQPGQTPGPDGDPRSDRTSFGEPVLPPAVDRMVGRISNMFGRVLRNGAVLLVSLGVTVGCGSSDRPREIAVSDVQPCQLLSTPELRELPTISGPHLVEDLVDGGGLEGSTCQYPGACGADLAADYAAVACDWITTH